MISRKPLERPVVVVIGAGAAGIAAGRELTRHGVSFIILEARERIGGRAHTVFLGGDPVDLGGGWLHSANRNVLVALAAKAGLTLDRSQPPWRKRNPQVGFDAAAQAEFGAAGSAFFARLEAAARDGADRPAAELLAPGCRWNGLLDAISTFYNGAPLSRVSVIDFDRYLDTEVDWRIAEGLGTFVARLGDGLPVRRGCSVSAVRLAGRAIRLETSLGAISADRLIVTVPPTLLASGAIRLDPMLDPYVEAASGLPLGVADKVFLGLDASEAFAPDTRLLGRIDRVDSGSYTLRPRGLPLVEGYFGGDYARELEKGGLAAFADAATREIGRALGRDVSRRLRPLAATAWAQDPFARGSYSHARPGRAKARAALAMPFEDRILFAGEATSPHFFSTVHGAWEEGERAALFVAKALQSECAYTGAGARL